MAEDREENLRKAGAYIREAAAQGAEIVCLPELFHTRYFPTRRGSFEKAEAIPGPTSRWLAEAARGSKAILVGGSMYEKDGRSRYNTCLVFDAKGRRVSKYRKVHIPQDEHYYEQDYFKPGDGYAVAKTSKGRLGTLICFDQWYPEAARVNRIMGADILFYPTAIGWVDGVDMAEGDWKRAWEEVQVGHAIANSVVVCAVNRVGKEGPTTFWGGSFVCDQFGKVLLRCDDSEGAFTADCDLGLGGVVEEGWGFFRNRRKGTYSAIAKR
jgi:agmatine deiminase